MAPRNGKAWEELLDLHMPLIAGIVYRVASRWGTPQRLDVEDAIQEACLKLSQQARAQRFKHLEERAVEPYLKALIANAATDYFRARRAQLRDIGKTSSLSDPAYSAGLGSLSDSAAHVERKILLNQIEKLCVDCPRDLVIFRLYYVQSFTAKEIAAFPAFGLTEKGVESLVRRLRMSAQNKIDGGEGISSPRTS